MGETHQVRRYGNRKLYHVGRRRYITLDEIATLVARGEEVAVVDRKTGEDLTSLTLAQILLEGQRQRTARIPRPLLVQLVRLSAGAAGGSWPRPKEVAQQARREAERIVGGLLARGRLSLEEALALRQELVRSWSGLVSQAQAGLEAGLHRLFGGAGGDRGSRRVTVAAERSRAKAGRPARARARPKRNH
jgi:polyhydroxyalkanoate synthesis repressor PhaR